MDIISWIKTTLSKYSSNNTHDKNAIYFVKNEDGKTGKIISDEVVYGNGGDANGIIVESPNQPIGGESVWVNPDEDPEEVEVYNRSQVDALLQGIVGSIASLSESGYLFSGVAISETDPGTPDAKVFYIANGKGTYEKFGGINVTEDEVVVLYWDSAWHKIATGIASQEKLSELEGYEHRTMVEAMVSLAARVDALEARQGLLGNAKAGTLDVSELTKCLYPTILRGHGVPAATNIPDNLPAGLPWDGVPVFIGQLYINLDATSGGLYYAVGHDSVSNWKQA